MQQNVLFDSVNLSPEILKGIADMGYTQMTEIQAKAIPLILEGKDVIGRSSTGTGKTAAFGVPAVEIIEGSNRPEVLVLSPTRELAMQISVEMSKYAKYKPSVRIATVYGGQSMVIQFKQLRSANIVVGTPGRIMDHMRRNTLSLEKVKMVVLDEADEMLNMGFFEDMQTILKEAPEERQTLLFSATMPSAIMNLTKEFQTNPEVVAVDKGKRTLSTISQYYYYVPQTQKMDALNLLLQGYRPSRAVVFCNTKKMVDDLVDYLNQHKFKSIGLHGDMKQAVRSQVMSDYKNSKFHILVATDVAARGIDIDDVDAVFNYDIPTENEYYIHRIGRTGRAGKTGSSFTLATNQMQVRKLCELENFLNAPIKERPLPTAEEIMQHKDEKFTAKLLQTLEETEYNIYLPQVSALMEEGHSAENLAAALMQMMLGKDKKQIPVIKVQAPAPRGERSFNKVVVRFDIGRNQRIAPNFIIGAVTERTGLPASSIGKIDIFPDFTNVEVNSKDAETIVEQMQGKKIKNIPVSLSITAKNTSRDNAPREYRQDRNYAGGRFGGSSNKQLGGRSRQGGKPADKRSSAKFAGIKRSAKKDGLIID